jgi:hypothetical protein
VASLPGRARGVRVDLKLPPYHLHLVQLVMMFAENSCRLIVGSSLEQSCALNFSISNVSNVDISKHGPEWRIYSQANEPLLQRISRYVATRSDGCLVFFSDPRLLII